MRRRTGKARGLASRLGPILLACAAGCQGGSDHDRVDGPSPETRPGVAPSQGGPGAGKVVSLEQGWTPELSRQFYFTSQGSQIVPYAWFLKLEQAGDKTLLRDDANLRKFGFLLHEKDGKWNPDGLPVGFARDEGRRRGWLGFTCAACHTAEIDYQGVGYRIEGGPASADVRGFLFAVAESLKATRDQEDKFRRFSAGVLGAKDAPDQRDLLKADLTEILGQREGYNARNFPDDAPPLPGRVDALGAILNEVFHNAVKPEPGVKNTANTVPANAPVSYPCLWDTPQHNVVQWNGVVKNTGLGPLGRNVGEVLGVFGKVEIPDHPGIGGYPSTVKVRNLLAIEDWLKTLWSPRWPAAFPAVDKALSDQGKTVYKKAKCGSCHEEIDRTDPFRRVEATLASVGTDRRMADNFDRRVSATGKLEGAYVKVVGSKLLNSPKFKDRARGDDVLSHEVIGAILGSPFQAPEDELTEIEYKRKQFRSMDEVVTRSLDGGAAYKARPLNGVWATAPYLHNGSVPTLYHLLLPAKDRPKSFTVGSREFDPKNVGLRTDAPGYPRFKARNDDGTPVGGNSNEGHETDAWAKLNDAERWALVEYLKTL